jgi:glyoxylase-like metal-dependent hydrolase (beta-lactamase superfamily II)
VEVDVEVSEGDTADVGGLKLASLHLPGHCSGMIRTHNPASGILHSADVMHYPTPLGSFPIGDAKAHWISIQLSLSLAFLAPGIVKAAVEGRHRPARAALTPYHVAEFIDWGNRRRSWS